MNYAHLCELYDRILGTTKHITKTYYISQFLKECEDEDLKRVVLLIQGRVFPKWDPRKIGVASQLIIKALSMLSKGNSKEITNLWKEKGDLGDVSEEVVKKKTQMSLFSRKLSIKMVFDTIVKIATFTGSGSTDFKIKSIVDLLLSSSPIEAKYIVRTILEEMRVGVGDGILRDAIAWAFLPKAVSEEINVGTFGVCPFCNAIVPTQGICVNCGKEVKKYKLPKDAVNIKDIREFYKVIDETSETKSFNQKDNEKSNDFYFKSNNVKEINDEITDILQYAYDISNDFSEIAIIAKDYGLKGLKEVKLKPMRPVNLMLYLKAPNLKAAMDSFDKPIAIEYKYDGFRLQIHGDNGKIGLFTRKLENVTKQFPDVVKAVRKHVKADSFIIDSELVGRDVKTNHYLAFQNISTRIKRKYDVSDAIKKTPVEVNAFDILYHNGKNIMNLPFKERRKILSEVIEEEKFKIVLAKEIITSDLKEADNFYKEALEVGNEGVMVKPLNAKYRAGRKVGNGLKVKPIMETLDLVVVGAEWGEGKRKGWLTTYELACLDENGNYVTIGKVGTGFKELESSGLTFSEMSDMLKPLIIETNGKKVKVKPQIVLEIAYEEIQKSPTYGSEFALRFPRVVRLRDDLNPNEISDIKLVKYLYKTQRGRNKDAEKEFEESEEE